MSISADIDLSTGATALGVLAFRGSDAARFLQGQLSADIEKLEVGASTLAGFHNAQGRTIALLAVLRSATDEFLAVLPREMTAGVAQRLGKFVLRAKLRISDESATWRVHGVIGGNAQGLALAWGDRQLALRSGAAAAPEPDAVALAAWLRADVYAGLPQVYAATSENFVAQMLNLDLLGAIAFDKGCYTGQEVIARTHYRGRVKRRLQRWLHTGTTPLRPGEAVRGVDGRALSVVNVAPENGGQAVLAVGVFADAGGSEAEPGSGDVPAVTGPLPLPYDLPN